MCCLLSKYHSDVIFGLWSMDIDWQVPSLCTDSSLRRHQQVQNHSNTRSSCAITLKIKPTTMSWSRCCFKKIEAQPTEPVSLTWPKGPCEVLPSLGVRRRPLTFSYFNLLLWNNLAKWNQTWHRWSLGVSLLKLCLTAPPSIQDGCCFLR